MYGNYIFTTENISIISDLRPEIPNTFQSGTSVIFYVSTYPSSILRRLHDFAARWDQLIPERVTSALS